jgi:aminotransferase
VKTRSYSPPRRLTAIAPSKIRENMRIARDVDAINLAQGRPDFPTAPELKQAAVAAIEADHNQYSVTWGLAELRSSIARMLNRRFGVEPDPETELTITCGVTEGMVAAMLALVEPGDEVLVLEPAHENYVPSIHFAGGTPRFVALRPPEFELPIDDVRKAVTDRTKVIVINTPNNPCGRVFSREELAALIEIAERHDAYIITDEIYDHLVYPPKEHVCPAAVGEGSPRIVTTGGISKIYAVTGWRLGYVWAAPEVTEGIRTVHDYLTICAPTPFQHAALTALDFPASYYEELLRTFVKRRERIAGVLRAAGFDPYEPEGAYYILASYDRWGFDGDSEAMTRHLITDGGVATVPGTAFYLGTEEVGRDLVRFAFATSLETLDAVGERLSACYERTR